MDFVLGIKIELSNQHPVTDICDFVQGDYPKDFVFDGWHPQCFCYATPILISEDEMAKVSEAFARGETYIPKGKPVTDTPKGFKKWVKDHKEQIQGAKNPPYWVRNNKAVVNGIWRKEAKVSKTYSTMLNDGVIMIPTEIKDLSVVRRRVDAVFEEHPEWFNKGYKGLEGVSVRRSYMSTDIKGRISINFATDSNGFNAGDCLVSAFDKIGKDGAKAILTRDEEYSLEALWHEVLHNTSKNNTILPNILDPMRGFERVALETCHQLYARHTYSEFCKAIGYTVKHDAWVMASGYGYKDMVYNLRMLLDVAKINESSFVKKLKPLLMGDYAEFQTRIKALLREMYKGKGDIEGMFDMLEIQGYERFVKNLA